MNNPIMNIARSNEENVATQWKGVMLLPKENEKDAERQK
jgi:hypothetical protein